MELSARRRVCALLVGATSLALLNTLERQALAAARAGTNGRPKEGRALSYVAIGDSTGVGVGATGGGYVARLHARLAERAPGIRLVNLCTSGATVLDALSSQAPRVPRGFEGLVTIGIGVNDVARNVPANLYAERLAALVAAVRARTRSPIVLTNLPDAALAPVIPQAFRPVVAQQVERFNELHAALAARQGLTVFDAHAMSRRFVPEHPEFFSGDGFHPSDAGYAFWAEKMWPVVRAALGSPALQAG